MNASPRMSGQECSVFAWAARRGEVATKAESDAKALIAEHDGRLRRGSPIAKRTGKRIRKDTPTLTAADADTTTTDVAWAPKPAPWREVSDHPDQLAVTIARGEREHG
jgi:hypothetical protein